MDQDLFSPNRTFERVLKVGFWKMGTPLLKRVKIRAALRHDDIREEMEFAITQAALVAGVIPRSSKNISETGIYVGDWLTDLLDWIINNWDSILEIIMTIINLFQELDMAVDYDPNVSTVAALIDDPNTDPTRTAALARTFRPDDVPPADPLTA